MERHRSSLTCVLVTLVFLQGTLVESYKILMVFPSFSKSHLIIASSAMKGLAEEGHEVTVVSSFPQKETIPNYRDVFLPVPEVVKSKWALNLDPWNKQSHGLSIISSCRSRGTISGQ